MLMPRRGENIYKRKDGRWEGRYTKERVDGKIKYGYVFAKTYKEVKNKLTDMNYSSDMQQKENKNTKESMQSESFSMIAKEWFAAQTPQLKQSSIVKYANILNSYILPAFGDKKISEITRDELATFSNTMLVSGGVNNTGLSPKTVTSIISILKSILNYASQVKGYPMVDMSRIAVKQSQKPMRILSRIEQQKLNKYLCEDLNLCNLGILVCLYTGLRVGEICALKWEDISFEEQYLYVHQTMQRLQTQNGEKKTMVTISTPKSDCSVRKIPIPNDIFQLLIDFKQPADTFFLTGMAHTYIEPRTMQNRFKVVIKHCNIDDANFHALRHTFATRCVELGFDVKSLSEILGHASVNITLNRYVHPSMELKQKNMNMLADLFAVK